MAFRERDFAEPSALYGKSRPMPFRRQHKLRPPRRILTPKLRLLEKT